MFYVGINDFWTKPEMLSVLQCIICYLVIILICFFFSPILVALLPLLWSGDYKNSPHMKKKNVAVNDISLRAAVTNYALASWRFRFLRRFVISHTRNSSHWLRIILQRDIQSH